MNKISSSSGASALILLMIAGGGAVLVLAAAYHADTPQCYDCTSSYVVPTNVYLFTNGTFSFGLKNTFSNSFSAPHVSLQVLNSSSTINCSGSDLLFLPANSVVSERCSIPKASIAAGGEYNYYVSVADSSGTNQQMSGSLIAIGPTTASPSFCESCTSPTITTSSSS